MEKGAKIAIGCAIAAVLLGGAVIVALVGGAFWVRGKAEKYTRQEGRIQELRKKANAGTFAPPADGVIAEDRFLKFLDIRRRVFAVYEKHKDEIEGMKGKKQADFGDVSRGLGLLNELRAAQAEAQADLGMGDGEYRYMVQQV